MAAEYTRIAAHLPAVFAADRESFEQVEGFLALADELNRTYLERLSELPAWYSPAGSAWPPGLPTDAGGDALLARISALHDELADWYGFVFPGSWRIPEGLTRKREFLLRAARLWRRRGTPRGFVDWFCLWFGISEPSQRPVLVEHFKYATAGERAGTPQTDDDGRPRPLPWLRATLFVPVSAAFPDAAARTEASLVVERYAPAHLLVRLCWVPGDFVLERRQGPDEDDPETEEQFLARVRVLLCELVDLIEHKDGLRLGNCIDEGAATDRLDVGRLPTDVTEG
ncbi:hypothetical protein F7R91_09910 [Streptomyces luteolifulvus]|jgi:hypothetical protein|uniref:Uncharacterized protein n=1 Tax=Streptomyces luteolifulvus TaxID=2615112 RepID=A0A6H9V551_9ACTN|nr:hypothetical protein [Streptomyces luteolifulvus]KAB1148207.1 hypothetical protein F7R91_09910 [Streptomyces luteolifulvus]